MPKDIYQARVAQHKKEQKALKKIEKAKIREQKARDKAATSERKHREHLAKLKVREEKNIAIAKERESLARRRKATRTARASHPISRGLSKIRAPKAKGGHRRSKPWWEGV